MSSISSHSPVCAEPKRITRRSKLKKGTSAQRTRIPVGNGFLTHHFVPVRDNHPALENAVQVEKQFFVSLFNLANLYNFKIPEITEQPFPLNVATTYEQVKIILKEFAPQLELIIIQDEAHPACLATVDSLSMGNTLYYIPVQPLYRLIKNKQKMPCVWLLLSTFSYLYHVAQIPFYRESSAYLHHCYETIAEWYIDNGESSKKEIQENEREINKIFKGGDRVLKQIKSTNHLHHFEKRLKKFNPQDELEKEVLKIATNAFRLWQSNPHNSILSSIPEGLMNPEIEERIRADCYLSFFWDSEDYFYHSLMEYINSDLQEYAVVDEPISIQLFDSPQSIATHDLSFERNLFVLMDDLCTVLNKIT